MKSASVKIEGTPRAIILSLGGALIGAVIAVFSNPLPLTPRDRLIPAAYRVPKIPGGTPLRMAMVHDVLHERYLRHGSAWYTRRNLDARKIIPENTPAPGTLPSMKYLDAMDDLAIGLQSLGQFEEATRIMRAKLALLPPISVEPTSRPTTDENVVEAPDAAIDRWDLERIIASKNLSPIQHHQYSARANLGTILVHGAMSKAMARDAEANKHAREGLMFIKQSIAINPGAHFGRETWQAIAIEHLLAGIDHPELLTEYNLIGAPVGGEHPVRYFSGSAAHRIMALMPDDAQLSVPDRLDIRSRLDRIGIDPEWSKIVHPDLPRDMPFDEPTLAIIGMWTLGGGPSPHFALALANIMEAAGQRNIAWDGYERAVELQDRFWPNQAIRDGMIKLCRDGQARLAMEESPTAPDAWETKMRGRHQRELAWGTGYQKAYQDYEAAQIAAGVPLDAPDFYDAFLNGRTQVASPTGLADDDILTQREAARLTDFLPCMILGGGTMLLLASLTDRKRGIAAT